MTVYKCNTLADVLLPSTQLAWTLGGDSSVHAEHIRTSRTTVKHMKNCLSIRFCCIYRHRQTQAHPPSSLPKCRLPKFEWKTSKARQPKLWMSTSKSMTQLPMSWWGNATHHTSFPAILSTTVKADKAPVVGVCITQHCQACHMNAYYTILYKKLYTFSFHYTIFDAYYTWCWNQSTLYHRQWPKYNHWTKRQFTPGLVNTLLIQLIRLNNCDLYTPVRIGW